MAGAFTEEEKKLMSKKVTKNEMLIEFKTILDEMYATAERKNHDYAGNEDPLSNLERSANMGIPPWKGIVIRLGDKYSRLESFCRQGELRVKDESVEDTFMDNANYSILGLILYRKWRKRNNFFINTVSGIDAASTAVNNDDSVIPSAPPGGFIS